ncbi:MAG: hypothetical protein P1V51_12195 [Deltaproteobacteria bacterium]|nr:hypothetical protein [Deltaproteobacteria bacterium]
MSHRTKLAALLSLTLGLLAPGAAGAAVRPTTGGTLRLAVQTPGATAPEARSLPGRIRASLDECTLGDLLAGPPQVDEEEDRLILLLEEGLVFQDGSKLDAAAVVESLSAHARGSGGVEAWRLLVLAGAAERMSGAEGELGLKAIGARRLELRLSWPLGAGAVELLSHPGLPLRSKGGAPCGPFQAREGGRDGVLVPFDRHPRGRPYFDRVQLFSTREGSRQGKADLRLEASVDTPRELPLTTRSLTFLQVNASPALREQIDGSLDRKAIVRYLVGGRARQVSTLLPDAPPGASRSSGEAPPRRALTLAFDGEDPVHRRIAERIQVRLHDGGLEVALQPLPARERGALLTGATELALITLPGLPRDPARGLAAVSHAVLGARAAQEVLETAAAAERAGGGLGAALGELEARLPVVFLYGEDEVVWIGDSLQGAEPSGTLPFDPGDLWRWESSTR